MNLGFILGEFFNGVRRNLAMTFSVMLVTFTSLMFVGIGMLFQAQIDLMKGYWYDKVEVSMFLCTDVDTAPTCAGGEVTQAQREAIEQRLLSPELSAYVEKVDFESKQQAYENYVELSAGSPEMYEEVDPSDMPESFRVKLVDPEQYEVIAEAFTGTEGVASVQDQRSVLEPLFAFFNRLTFISAGVAVVMVIAASLLINTTIRLSAFNRRREVGIMRLVGASSVVISLPFLLEGIFAASLGALLASGALFAFLSIDGVAWLMDSMQTSVGLSALVMIVPVLFIIAIALAAVSSGVALRKYLNV